MTKQRKRTSQTEFVAAYKTNGVEGVRALLEQFPGAKQTFRKVIDRMRDEFNKPTKDLEALWVEKYGLAREYVDANPDPKLYGTAEEVAKELGIPQGLVYVACRGRCEPAFYIRTKSGKGKGMALYEIQDVEEALKAHQSAQAEKYLTEYDPESEVTTKDVVSMLPPEWGWEYLQASQMINLMGVQPSGKKYRPADQKKGPGSTLYCRKQIQIAIDGVAQARTKVAEA